MWAIGTQRESVFVEDTEKNDKQLHPATLYTDQSTWDLLVIFYTTYFLQNQGEFIFAPSHSSEDHSNAQRAIVTFPNHS